MCEYPGDVRPGRRLVDQHVAGVGQLDLAGDQLHAWVVADRDDHHLLALGRALRIFCARMHGSVHSDAGSAPRPCCLISRHLHGSAPPSTAWMMSKIVTSVAGCASRKPPRGPQDRHHDVAGPDTQDLVGMARPDPRGAGQEHAAGADLAERHLQHRDGRRGVATRTRLRDRADKLRRLDRHPGRRCSVDPEPPGGDGPSGQLTFNTSSSPYRRAGTASALSR